MPGSVETVAIAILAKAPVAGFAKTRLAPALGPERAARLHARLIRQTVETACMAAIGPITLWSAPDPDHGLFTSLAARHRVRLARQPDGDLGARMLAAIETAGGPALIIGTDCPVLTPDHLRQAAAALREGCDAVVVPAEDGGYVLIGLSRPQPRLFADMAWSVPTVLAETRRRFIAERLRFSELPALWDVDVPSDLRRLREAGLDALLTGLDADPPTAETARQSGNRCQGPVGN
jgi:rSAM/selenodomain-associated transferase 1